MKLTTVVIAAAALAGAAGAASTASATAIVLSEYQGSDSAPPDAVAFSVVNDGGTAYTDVNIDGVDLGALAAGARTTFIATTDSSAFNIPISVTVSGTTYTQNFTALYGDVDTNTAPIFNGFLAGTGAAPEPASWALMLAGVGGLGAAMRMRRKAPVSA